MYDQIIMRKVYKKRYDYMQVQLSSKVDRHCKDSIAINARRRLICVCKWHLTHTSNSHTNEQQKNTVALLFGVHNYVWPWSVHTFAKIQALILSFDCCYRKSSVQIQFNRFQSRVEIFIYFRAGAFVFSFILR